VNVELAVIQCLGGLFLLFIGGELLVKGSVRLATGLGMSPLVAGVTIVAFGTSTPELAVTLHAALEGYNDLAVGTVVGSNICNIALVLGFSALIRPINVNPQVLRFDFPILVVCSAFLAVLLHDDHLSRFEGMFLVLGVLGYILMNLWSVIWRSRERAPTAVEMQALQGSQALKFVVFIVVGIFSLVGGGYVLVRGGVVLATALGVSNAIIALTVVALGTSLPELVTSIVASARSYTDIVLGNVIGTNIFNILAILGITAVAHPLVRGNVGWTAISAMLVIVLVLIPILHSGLRISRLQGVFLLLCYVLYVSWGVGA